MLRLGQELLAPTLVDAATLAEATTVQFPGLAGIVPGFGRMDPCDWGLGFEIRDGKAPHWTATANSPATFGHFGGSGTFLWVDPDAGVACAALTDRDFGRGRGTPGRRSAMPCSPTSATYRWLTGAVQTGARMEVTRLAELRARRVPSPRPAWPTTSSAA